MEFFGGFFFLAVLLGLASTGVCIWGIVDSAMIPDHAWQASGENKTLWIILNCVGLLTCLGVVLTIVYFVAIRPKVVVYR